MWEIFYNFWSQIFGVSFTDETVLQLVTLVSCVGVVAFIIAIPWSVLKSLFGGRK
jgi:hypothetical protein